MDINKKVTVNIKKTKYLIAITNKNNINSNISYKSQQIAFKPLSI